MDAVPRSAAAAGNEPMDAGGRVGMGTSAKRARPLRRGRGRDSDRDAESRSESRVETRSLETARRLVSQPLFPPRQLTRIDPSLGSRLGSL